MPPSRALTSFFHSVASAQSLITEEAKYPDPPAKADEALVIGLRGGASVLMVAAFEQFLRSMLEERLSSLVAVPPVVEFSRLPDSLRVASVFGGLEIAMGTRRGGGRGPRLERLPAVRRASQIIAADFIDPSALAQLEASPKSSSIRQLFRGIDLPDVFAAVRSQFDILWAKPEASSFVEDKLDEVVGRRHVVAHTADALKITRAQLSESVHFLQVLGTVLDDAAEQKVVELRARAAPVP
jgi:hypothetical protein